MSASTVANLQKKQKGKPKPEKPPEAAKKKEAKK